jgi:predicted ATPase
VGTTPEAETERLAEQVRRERVWRVSGAPGHGAEAGRLAPRRAPLVGREAELGNLLEAWGRCRAGRGAALCLVTGEPGAGRTRLVEELVARARLDGAAVTATRAVQGDLADAGAGVFALAAGGLLGAQGIAGARSTALGAFAARLPEWADRFPAVRGVTPDPPSRALVELLRAAVEEQPVVIAVDDAHWLDRDSLVALEGVLRDLAVAPVLVVLSVGLLPPAEIDALRARLGRDVAGVCVQVGPLGADALRALAGRILPEYGDEAIDRVTRRVLVDSAGLPLLAVELLHAVALGLDLQREKATWPAPFHTLDETMPGDLPDAVIGAIRVGFRRLAPDAQRVLVAAAVQDGRVPADVLGRATGLAAEPLAAALDELEWQRWLVADPRGYDFVARIVRAVVERDMLTPGQRQRFREAAQTASPRT